LRNLLPELARTYGVNFIADAYWHAGARLLPRFFQEESGQKFALLDFLESAGTRWDRSGDLIRLRSPYWFLSRPREVPARLVRRWSRIFDERGALPLEEYLQMVRL